MRSSEEEWEDNSLVEVNLFVKYSLFGYNVLIWVSMLSMEF